MIIDDKNLLFSYLQRVQVSDAQPWNAPSLMVVTLVCERLADVTAVLEKALLRISASVAGKRVEVSDAQSWNAHWPMVVTRVCERSAAVMELFLKALSLISSSVAGKSTEARDEQSRNAASPMLVTAVLERLAEGSKKDVEQQSRLTAGTCAQRHDC